MTDLALLIFAIGFAIYFVAKARKFWYEAMEIHIRINRILAPEIALKECINAITSGEKMKDSRGHFYRQDFGTAFVEHLQRASRRQ